MAQNRYYSSTAVGTTIVGAISNSATTIVVASVSGFPGSFPYTLILERDTALEEVITVTAAAGTTLTATRGVDSTAGVGHSSGASVEHGVSARDFNEPQAHMAASSGVHGATGSVVGTTDTQTLTNKTISAGSTLGGVSGTDLAADRTAWTAYTPTYTNCTSPTGTAAYKLIGKTLYIRWFGTGGSVTVTADMSVSLPAGVNTSGAVSLQAVAGVNGDYRNVGSLARIQSAQTAGTSLSGLAFTGVIEVA